MANKPFQPPVSIVTFFNFTDQEFTGYWDKTPYHFAPGEKMRMEDWKAKHFAKHLADQFCFSMNKPNRRKEQAFIDIMAKAIIAGDGRTIANTPGEVSKLQTELVGDDAVDYGKDMTETELRKEAAKENGKDVEEKKPFCSQCASKGVRHMKNCPTLKTDAPAV